MLGGNINRMAGTSEFTEKLLLEIVYLIWQIKRGKRKWTNKISTN